MGYERLQAEATSGSPANQIHRSFVSIGLWDRVLVKSASIARATRADTARLTFGLRITKLSATLVSISRLGLVASSYH